MKALKGKAVRRGAAALIAALLATAAAHSGAAEGGVTVRFEGNSNVGAAELRAAIAEALPWLEDSDRARAAADDAAFLVEEVYRQKGYAFVAASYGVEGAPGPRTFTLTVDEGPRVLLGRVSFRGSDFFAEERLRSLVAGQGRGEVYTDAAIQEGVNSIRNLYYGEGFLDAVVAKPEIRFSEDRARADVDVTVTEGARYVVRSVVFEGDVVEEALSGLRGIEKDLVGRPYYSRRKLFLRTRTWEAYANKGYGTAVVDVQEREGGRPGDVVLAAVIRSGPKVTVADVVVEGNDRTRASFVRKQIPLARGDTFSPTKMREAFKILYGTGLFRRVEYEFDPPDEDGAQVLRIAVEEVPAREVFGEVGWGSYEKLRGRAGVSDRNLFGSGKFGSFGVGGSLKGIVVETDFADPRFLGLDLRASVPVSYSRRLEPSYTTREIEVSAQLMRQISRRTRANLRYSYKLTGISDADPDVKLTGLDEDYTLGSLKLQVSSDTRNDIFFPTGGGQVSLAGEAAEKLLGSGLTFLRFTGTARYFLSLGSRTVLGLRYDGGLLLPTHGDVDVPLSERFFNGGENTVRSFTQDQLGPKSPSGEPFGGTAFNVLSVEGRVRASDQVALSLFFDWGNVAPNLSLQELSGEEFSSSAEIIDITLKDFLSDFRPAIGAGVQYLLPVGPLRVDGAWNPDAREGEPGFTAHFSIGMAF